MKPHFEPRPFYTPAEVARLFKVSLFLVHKLCDQGLLPCWLVPPMGSHRRINHQDLVAFLEADPDYAPFLATVRLAERLDAARRDQAERKVS
jgi:excisionase family DNA binding protein